MEVARAKEDLANFKKNKDYQKFAVTNPKTGSTKYLSLAEIGLNNRASMFEQTIEYFMETAEVRAARRSIEKQFVEKSSELKENLRSAADLLKTAEEIKSNTFSNKTRNFSQPIFTPQELLTLELRAGNPAEKSEATYLHDILNSVDHSKVRNLPTMLESFVAREESAKSIEKGLASEQKSSIEINKVEQTSEEKKIEVRENKTEIINQERGR